MFRPVQLYFEFSTCNKRPTASMHNGTESNSVGCTRSEFSITAINISILNKLTIDK